MSQEGQASIVSGPLTFRRHVLPADRETVRRIVQSTAFFTPAEVDVAVELADENLKNRAASGYHFIFVEEVAGTALGYACYGPIACTVASYDLYWIAVHKDSQGRGLGRILVQEAERLVRESGGRRIYIETSGRAQYQPTRDFYERCGYRQEAVLRDFYAPGDDKVIYLKALP